MSISCQRLDKNMRPHDSQFVNVWDCSNVYDISYSVCKGKGSPCRKIDRDTYVNTNTGEVCEFNHNANRMCDIISLKNTFAQARRVINLNTSCPEKCLFITLTYAENMTDCKKLYDDVRNFWKKKFHVQYPNTEYINAVEPQGRGAWHCHLIVIFDDIPPYIPNEVLRNMWGHGFVRVQSLKGIDNIGAYLSAYMTDVEVDANMPFDAFCREKCIVDDNGNVVPKRFKKGGRLHMYPSGMRIFRYSKGIKMPVKEIMSYKDAMDRLKQKETDAEREGRHVKYERTYECTKEITDEDTGFRTIVNVQSFKGVLKHEG